MRRRDPFALSDPMWIPPGLARWLLVLALLSITWLALAPNPSPDAIEHLDKLKHVAAFAVLAALGAAAWPSLASPWPIFLGLLLYGGLLEWLQSLLPTRFASVADLAADALGLLLFFGLRQLLGKKRYSQARISE
jgi:VanZ family protein